ncbi:unnamed protein product [Litomosoides sigmodontis]|uniref:Uncharacterized protein n=1 Tax=Litomosoides sigmodontis TaxID=42156 RepID=A0A3P7K7M6_LITSI|nr:unnamed protein product [Litomosoides sigmodontis]
MTMTDEGLRSIGTADQDLCRNSSNIHTMFSSSIRSREEFDFIKMLYRTFERKKWLIHADRNDLPLLIGLMYINKDYHWFDDSPFDYEGFMENGFKSNFSQFRMKDCRRFFLYSPPTRKLC